MKNQIPKNISDHNSIAKSQTVIKGNLNRGSDSHIDLYEAKTNQSDFGYDVVLATNQYHLVRHRNLFGSEDCIQLLPNQVSIPTKLPSVKMHLQTNRPPNLV